MLKSILYTITIVCIFVFYGCSGFYYNFLLNPKYKKKADDKITHKIKDVNLDSVELPSMPDPIYTIDVAKCERLNDEKQVIKEERERIEKELNEKREKTRNMRDRFYSIKQEIIDTELELTKNKYTIKQIQYDDTTLNYYIYLKSISKEENKTLDGLIRAFRNEKEAYMADGSVQRELIRLSKVSDELENKLNKLRKKEKKIREILDKLDKEENSIHDKLLKLNNEESEINATLSNECYD